MSDAANQMISPSLRVAERGVIVPSLRATSCRICNACAAVLVFKLVLMPAVSKKLDSGKVTGLEKILDRIDCPTTSCVPPDIVELARFVPCVGYCSRENLLKPSRDAKDDGRESSSVANVRVLYEWDMIRPKRS